jgi:hypothetical protein
MFGILAIVPVESILAVVENRDHWCLRRRINGSVDHCRLHLTPMDLGECLGSALSIVLRVVAGVLGYIRESDVTSLVR